MSTMPVVIAFLLSTMVALLFTQGSFSRRVTLFCRGAANETILLMVLIFVLAGAFAGTANAMGAVDATVTMALKFLPHTMIPASLFIAACFVSMSMGTSCGTIAALTPVAVGIAPQIGMDLPAMLGIVVGGAMFGDNLSFISDTTIVVTRTQGVEMRDKFKVNLRLVLPMAILCTFIYVYQGYRLEGELFTASVSWIKIVPYLTVLIAALAGMNVILVLMLGTALAGIIGLATGDLGLLEWAKTANAGIVGDMGELIIVSFMAGGLFELVRVNGGIVWLVEKLASKVKSQRKAESRIALLTILTNLCTANNTIALLIVGNIARNVGKTVNLSGKRTASLLDTLSCFTQSLLPYGAQLLIATSLAHNVSPTEVIPYLFYPMLLGVAVILSIIFRYPKDNHSSQALPSDSSPLIPHPDSN
ncbi:sodium:proton antiporter [Bacteroidia bacterium]|nr:sodium:proton antiporter [Bacteroidia bacterium]